MAPGTEPEEVEGGVKGDSRHVGQEQSGMSSCGIGGNEVGVDVTIDWFHRG